MTTTDERIRAAERDLQAAKQAKRDEKRRAFAERRAAGRAERDVHRDRMAAEYLEGYPKRVTDAVYAKAWEDGHAERFENVEFHYDELASLIRLAVTPEGANR